MNTILYIDQKTQAQRIKLHEAMNLDLNECSLSLFSLLLSCLMSSVSFLESRLVGPSILAVRSIPPSVPLSWWSRLLVCLFEFGYCEPVPGGWGG